MKPDLEELQAIESTMENIKRLQEEMPNEDEIQELNEVYSTLQGIQNLQEEVDYNQDELNEVYSTLKGIKDLMEEMEIPSLAELKEIFEAIKKAGEDEGTDFSHPDTRKEYLANRAELRAIRARGKARAKKLKEKK